MPASLTTQQLATARMAFCICTSPGKQWSSNKLSPFSQCAYEIVCLNTGGQCGMESNYQYLQLKRIYWKRKHSLQSNGSSKEYKEKVLCPLATQCPSWPCSKAAPLKLSYSVLIASYYLGAFVWAACPLPLAMAAIKKEPRHGSSFLQMKLIKMIPLPSVPWQCIAAVCSPPLNQNFLSQGLQDGTL